MVWVVVQYKTLNPNLSTYRSIHLYMYNPLGSLGASLLRASICQAPGQASNPAASAGWAPEMGNHMVEGAADLSV